MVTTNNPDWGYMCVRIKGNQHYKSFIGCDCMVGKSIDEYMEAFDILYGDKSE